MAKSRTPSNVLALRGAFKKDPARGRARQNEPDSNGDVGEPPASMDEEVKACWREIMSLTHPGVVCKADRLALEMAAHLLHQLRQANWLMPPGLLTRYETLIGKFGMTPADRSKVSAPKKEDDNPFANL
ncbi:hypothetical protein OOT46_29845 [Aquabacterium sp. A7-Y]|uniref:hypothetical protein n=1 Tax=Aquabacterium sp. A7-Y TaxID=1349605 RepID=UPI00223D4B19|nr:hypothetical protein [Aquabacterium sp. A7-Y]MCW7542004.1 hypothetical protein [Aquabacterium sp. A7-Y]